MRNDSSLRWSVATEAIHKPFPSSLRDSGDSHNEAIQNIDGYFASLVNPADCHDNAYAKSHSDISNHKIKHKSNSHIRFAHSANLTNILSLFWRVLNDKRNFRSNFNAIFVFIVYNFGFKINLWRNQGGRVRARIYKIHHRKQRR